MVKGYPCPVKGCDFVGVSAQGRFGHLRFRHEGRDPAGVETAIIVDAVKEFEKQRRPTPGLVPVPMPTAGPRPGAEILIRVSSRTGATIEVRIPLPSE